jgi:orotate phosphoribosyltransferase
MMGSESSNILDRLGAIVKDSHVVYTSGKHGSAYVNKDVLYRSPVETSAVCRDMAKQADEFFTFRQDRELNAVLGPVIGGVVLAQWVAYHLAARQARPPFAIFAEKEGDDFVIKRGYDALIEGTHVLVVEDVLTTGGSVRKVIKAARACGAEVIGVSAICNRGGLTAEALGVECLFSLINVTLEAWDETDCPLCARNVPINTQVGKGWEYLTRKSTGRA